MKRPGVVYTPPEVARPMVERALGPLVAGRTPEQILALRVCDPAVGEGALLVAAVELLAAAARVHPRRALPCVVGADLDADALLAARDALAALAGTEPAPRQLQQGDALALDWTAFGAPFDAVVGNPPYVRQELLPVARKAALRDYAVYDGVADLYVYFVELAHRIARRWCLVLPDKWLTAAYARPLRGFLARTHAIEGVLDFADAPRLFPGIDAFPCIAWGGHTPASTISAARTSLPPARALAGPLPEHARSRFTDAAWLLDADDRLDELARRFPPLAERLPAPPQRGVVTGCNRAFVIDVAARAALLAADPACAAHVRPFLRGRDLRRWRAEPAQRYLLAIDRGTPLASLPAPLRAHLSSHRAALEPGSGRKPGAYLWHELQDPLGPLVRARAPRLLYQDIQARPACCLDPGDAAPDTTVWMLPTDDKLLLAILNSSTYAWYARAHFPPALGGAVRPKRAYLTRLPVPEPAPALRTRIERLVDAQLARPTSERDAELDDAVALAYQLTTTPRASHRTVQPPRPNA